MTDIPKVNPRDMATLVGKTASTHEAIQQGIRERAAEHEKYLASRDATLNASARLTGKTAP